jgi:tRNA-dihydrouridine synthase B
MWKLGDLEISGRVVLGPMSGYTSSGYRDFMKPFGVAVSVTEMISATGLLHGQDRTMDYVRFPRNAPTGVQLFGNGPETMAFAAREAMKANPDIDFFDINMGCPASKVLRTSAGAALMDDPERCGEIVRMVKWAVDVPVTAKIRLGANAERMNFRKVIKVLEDAGVDAIALHARTKAERYIGEPHYDLIKNLQSEMSVPLIVSGNIYTADDAKNALDVTGAAAVMVARGGVGNPFLITQTDRLLRTGEVLPNPTISQQVDWCLELADRIMAEKGDEEGIMKMRSIAPRFIAGCHRSRIYRRRLAVETVDRTSLEALLEDVRARMGDERINSYGQASADPDDEF